MKKKTIALAGASGMIGSYLAGHLTDYRILKIEREDYNLEDSDFAAKFHKADIIINLTGSPVIRRWTKKNRKEMLESRIGTTQKLGCIDQRYPERQRMYLSASAIGIYNDVNIHAENSTKWGEGFLAELIKLWEDEARKLNSKTTSVCILRTGVVLSDEGGIIARMLPVFRLGIGGRIGSGKQYFSWIHIRDLSRAIAFILEKNINGIFNMTAPGYCDNREFTASMARAVRRPAVLIVPGWIFRVIFGKGAAIVTGGQAVVPERLMKEGFRFEFPDIESALKSIVN